MNTSATLILLTLRTWLESRLGADASIEDAALALQIPARTLQHHLRAAGTTFRTERTSVRLAVASRRLSETDTKIDAIACEVGFATSQYFSVWFRSLTQKTPSGFRAEARRAAVQPVATAA
ncbi:MAG: helix-turn-helix transcriptional regulator [Deltaproteobacteria bacterium]|nr:helix-turn-helix transcriptional regulator [Deltaproteobacteria bacterium]